MGLVHRSAPTQDTGGEYLGVTFLHDGSLAVVTPIQHGASKRFGFTWWKLERR